MLLNAPKYGNNCSYADEIAKQLDLEALKFTKKYSEEIGVHLDLCLVPFTSHLPFGKVVSATPNGRKDYTPLSDGCSASQGADTNGSTAVLLPNYHINIINKQTLINAQKEPDKYRILVRIAGYSAYFTDLSPDLQNDLIAWTEHVAI